MRSFHLTLLSVGGLLLSSAQGLNVLIGLEAVDLKDEDYFRSNGFLLSITTMPQPTVPAASDDEEDQKPEHIFDVILGLPRREILTSEAPMTGNDIAAHAFRLGTLPTTQPTGKYFLEPLIDLPRPASVKSAKQVRLGFRYRSIPSSDPDDDNNWGHHQDMLGLEYRTLPAENLLYDVTPGEGERVVFDNAEYNERVRACTRAGFEGEEEDEEEKEVWILMADKRGVLPYQELWECRRVKLVMIGLNDNIYVGNNDDGDDDHVQSISTAGGDSERPSPEKDDEVGSSTNRDGASRGVSIYSTPVLSRQRGHSRDFADVSEFRLDGVASSQASISQKSAGKATFRLQDDNDKDKEEERKDNDEERKTGEDKKGVKRN